LVSLSVFQVWSGLTQSLVADTISCTMSSSSTKTRFRCKCYWTYFYVVTDSVAKLALVFVPGKCFQICLIF